MSDSAINEPFDDTRRRRPRARKPRSGRAFAAVLLLLACGAAAFVLRQSAGGFGSLFQADSFQSFGSVPRASSAMAQPTDDLRQLVRDLQTSVQEVADKVELTQRQLASEQGERKLLAEQVGAISARIRGLSASNAAVVTAAAPGLPRNPPALNGGAALPKKKPALPPPAPLPLPR